MKNGVFWDVTPFGSCKNRRNIPEDAIQTNKTNSVALSPRANYTDWEDAILLIFLFCLICQFSIKPIIVFFFKSEVRFHFHACKMWFILDCHESAWSSPHTPRTKIALKFLSCFEMECLGILLMPLVLEVTRHSIDSIYIIVLRWSLYTEHILVYWMVMTIILLHGNVCWLTF
jgi:hypothetical protein